MSGAQPSSSSWVITTKESREHKQNERRVLTARIDIDENKICRLCAVKFLAFMEKASHIIVIDSRIGRMESPGPFLVAGAACTIPAGWAADEALQDHR